MSGKLKIEDYEKNRQVSSQLKLEIIVVSLK